MKKGKLKTDAACSCFWHPSVSAKIHSLWGPNSTAKLLGTLHPPWDPLPISILTPADNPWVRMRRNRWSAITIKTTWHKHVCFKKPDFLTTNFRLACSDAITKNIWPRFITKNKRQKYSQDWVRPWELYHSVCSRTTKVRHLCYEPGNE